MHVAQPLEHHSGGKNHGEWISESLTSDVRGRSVRGLEQTELVADFS